MRKEASLKFGKQGSELPEEYTLSFQALNIYHIRDGKPGMEYPWLAARKLVEPYRETTLQVDNPLAGMNYSWTVTETAGNTESVRADGVFAVVKVESVEEHTIVLEELSSTGTVTRRMEEIVMSKYVRREIRSLLEDEREELFDAMSTLWNVRTSTGKALYGEDYIDVWDINHLHHVSATDPDCDHFHDGLGFLTSHVLITNIFEHSLQLVNPKLSLPYWDFTIDTANGVGGEFDGNIPIFQDAWFGTVDTSDLQVKDSRWGYKEIPDVAPNSSVWSNIYGQMRAPWNINNRRYLTRGFGDMCGLNSIDYFPLPSCESHYLLSLYRNFYSWVWDSMYDPHGSVHIWIGGVLDCKKNFAYIADITDEEVAETLAELAFIHRKNLFRDNIFKCEGHPPADASPQEVMERGYCGCLGYNLDSGDDFKLIRDVMFLVPNLLESYDSNTQREVINILCSAPIDDGDQLQSSSPLDPSFWPTHPTMERLFLFKTITGTLDDKFWPESSTSYTDEDLESFDIVLSLYGDECYGHRGSDVFPFGLMAESNTKWPVRLWGKTQTNKFTNRDVLLAIDGTVNGLPYIYDSFSWPHCKEQGFDFTDLWSDNYDSVTDRTGGNPRPRHEKAEQLRMKVKDKVKDGFSIFREGEVKLPRYKGLNVLREKYS
ncbi:unnamed protein product [Choristocarpus tenellus]